MLPPTTVPGGNPTIAAPGLTPNSPVTVVGPVLVTVEPASTAKLPAVKSDTGAIHAGALGGFGGGGGGGGGGVRTTVALTAEWLLASNESGVSLAIFTELSMTVPMAAPGLTF